MPDFAALAEAGYEQWKRDRPGLIAVDTETEGVAFFDPAFCVTIAWADTAGGSIPMTGHYFELAEYDSRQMVREIMMETPAWAFHNAKFDLQKILLSGILERGDIQPHSFEDTEALAHLVDGNQKKALKVIAVNVLGIDDTVDVEIKSGPNKGNFKKVAREKHELDQVRKEMGLVAADGYHVLPREVVIPYAIEDVFLTLQAYDHFWPLLHRDEGLSALYEHEKRVTLTLLDMEAAGMALDLPYTEAQAKEYGRESVKTELEIRLLTGDEDFLPTSWQQVLGELHKRGHEVANTQSDTLEPLDDPFAKAILKLRGLRKIHGTYLMPMLHEQKDGVIHPNFRQHGTKTGRMSSGEAEE